MRVVSSFSAGGLLVVLVVVMFVVVLCHSFGIWAGIILQVQVSGLEMFTSSSAEGFRLGSLNPKPNNHPINPKP